MPIHQNRGICRRLLSFLLAAPLCLLLSSNTAAEEANRQRVKAVPIKVQTVTRQVSTYGTLSPKTEELSFKIPGRISSFRVEEGAIVKKGELLAQLETKDARDNLRKQRVLLDQAERSLARMEKLHRDGSIQKSQLEDAQDKFEQVKIAFEQAQLNLERCSLTAPGSGLILKEYLDSRTTVSAGTPIFAYQSTDEEWITKVELTDRNAFALGEGTTAKIRFAPYPDITFNGVLTKLSRVANPGDGLYTAEITITTNGQPLRPGMVAEVDLFKTSARSYVVVPFDALVDVRRNGGVIYLVSSDGSAAVEKPATIYAIEGNNAALMETFDGYEQVVVRGQTNLRDQSLIEIVE